MNRPIRKVSIVLGVLFVALFVNLNVVQVLQGSHYRDDPQNRRVLLNEYSSPRGQISAGGSGATIAESKRTGDELRYLRVYPSGKVYAPVTGYYSFTYGTSGIEDAENSILSGDSSQLFTSNLTGLLTGRDPKGGSVQLTINPAAQQAAYKAMNKQRGAVVALDPKTGAILAAVSTPSYDPNKLASHNSSTISKAYAYYNRASGQPLLNRAFRQIYPAGSVFKVIDSAAALQLSKPLTPSSELSAPGSYWPLQPNRTDPCPSNGEGACVENFEGETCDNGKTATLAFAFAKSCNTAFSKLVVNTIGGDALATQAQKFGLDAPYAGVQPPDFCQNVKIRTPLSVCRSTPGSQADLANDDSLAQTAIGQRDVGITPLQGAMIASAVADNGTLMKPYLVDKERREDQSVLNTTTPEQLDQVIDPDLDQQLISMMEGVVTSPEGTGGPAAITEFGDQVRVGGKTGTADHGTPDKNGKQPPPHAWFSGFALVKGEPRIAIAVIIENGGVTGDETTGGKAAAPVAKSVMTAYLKATGVN